MKKLLIFLVFGVGVIVGSFLITSTGAKGILRFRKDLCASISEVAAAIRELSAPNYQFLSPNGEVVFVVNRQARSITRIRFSSDRNNVSF